MSIGNKIIMSSLLVLVATALLAMEKESEKSQPLIITKKLPSDYSSHIDLSGIYAGLNHVSGCVASSLDSLSNTITNQISDEAAFRKLGWPPSDKIAQEELKKSEFIYKRHNEFFKNYEEYPEYLNDANAINRRTQYCQRVLCALYNNTILNHIDRQKLASHCLLHHGEVLNNFDKIKFLLFIKKGQEETKKDIEKIDQELEYLTTVSNNNNDLLNDFLDQTIKQKEEEQKKKLEEEQELQKQRELQKK